MFEAKYIDGVATQLTKKTAQPCHILDILKA